ncbi:MAG TPA: hypothetical protein VH440_08355 [Candidatus Limnocylindrales bacterium]
MSRRHHGGRPHRSNGHARPADPGRDRPNGARQAAAPFVAPAPPTFPGAPVDRLHDQAAAVSGAPLPVPADGGAHAGGPPSAHDDRQDVHHDGHAPNGANDAEPNGSGPNGAEGHGPPGANGLNGHAANGPAGCTAPQLRRFIKSRPYVPMHELRRRFGIDGGEDDMTAVDLSSGRIFVGLPRREGLLLGELLRGGEIGYELSMDPRSPVVVGLYPMRPVARA